MVIPIASQTLSLQQAKYTDTQYSHSKYQMKYDANRTPNSVLFCQDIISYSSKTENSIPIKH